MMLQIKFGCNRPAGLWDIHVWKCGRTHARTNARTPARVPSYKLTLWAFGSGELKTGSHDVIKLDPDQQEPLYKLNHINMILYNTGSQSPGDDKPEEPDQHDVIKTGPWSADIVPEVFYITLNPDQQEPVYQLNRISIMLYNTGSWLAGDVTRKTESSWYYITLNPDHQGLL